MSSPRPALHICALLDLDMCAASCGPTHIISMVPSLDAERLGHAWSATTTAIHIPDRERCADAPWAVDAARTLLAIGRSLTPKDRVLVHCVAGISRSTAAALLLDLAWERAHPAHATSLEDAIARLLAARPNAMPNGSLLGAADRLLDMDGALVRARADILGRALAR